VVPLKSGERFGPWRSAWVLIRGKPSAKAARGTIVRTQRRTRPLTGIAAA